MRSLRDATSLPRLVIIEGEVVDQTADATDLPEQPLLLGRRIDPETVAAMRGSHVCPRAECCRRGLPPLRSQGLDVGRRTQKSPLRRGVEVHGGQRGNNLRRSGCRLTIEADGHTNMMLNVAAVNLLQRASARNPSSFQGLVAAGGWACLAGILLSPDPADLPLPGPFA
jgi:hypothetical protein